MKKKLNLEELKIESFITSDDNVDGHTIKGGTGTICSITAISIAVTQEWCDTLWSACCGTDQSDCVCQTQATGMPGCDCGGGDTRGPYDPSPYSDTCQWA